MSIKIERLQLFEAVLFLFADKYLDSMKFPVFRQSKQKFIKFVNKNNNYTIVYLDTLSDIWGCFYLIRSDYQN